MEDCGDVVFEVAHILGLGAYEIGADGLVGEVSVVRHCEDGCYCEGYKRNWW